MRRYEAIGKAINVSDATGAAGGGDRRGTEGNEGVVGMKIIEHLHLPGDGSLEIGDDGSEVHVKTIQQLYSSE